MYNTIMSKIKSVKIKKSPKKKTGNYDTVLLEQMHDDIKLIAEGQTGIQRQLDELRTDVCGFKSDTESNFKLFFSHLSNIEDEIMEIKDDLKNNYEKKGWDKKWRETIEKKLERIEKILADKNMRVNVS